MMKRSLIFLLSLFVLGACASNNDANPFAGYDIPVVRDSGGGVVFADSFSPRDIVQQSCESDDDCPAELPYCNLDTGACLQCQSNADCDGDACLNGYCAGSAVPCNASTRSCIGDEVIICGEDGFEASRIDCAPNTCVDGQCVVCRPGDLSCNGDQVIRCKDDASGYDITTTCTTEGGCYQGVCITCHPGTGKCESGVAYRCDSEGSTWEFSDDCGSRGEECLQGNCIPLCGYDPKTGTNAGCDFYAVDLHNAYVDDGVDVYDAQNAQFAVIVSNTSSEGDAQVTITYPNGGGEDTQTIAPLSLGTFELPSYYGLDGSGIGDWAYRVIATRPVTVYQFNPLSNADVFSNDASVLMPSPAAGTEYYVASLPDGNPFRGYVTIIATGTGNTSVTVTPTVNTLAGTDVPAMSPGVPKTLTLTQGQVLNIESDELSSYIDNDISGTHVEADQPIIVFGGHVAASSPGSDCCADHLEQQLLPVSRWGTEYVAGRSVERNGEEDRWMIIASVDGTQVSMTPMDTDYFPVTLNAGEPYRFQSGRDFVISADNPIMLVQYLASSGDVEGSGTYCDTASDCPDGHTCVEYYGEGYCEPIGDPSMILSVPTAQYRKSYIFLTPDSYIRDHITVMAPVGATVQLDDTVIESSAFTAIPPTGYAVYRAEVSDGVHAISADQRIGIMVHGYDDDVSYGYPGGMGLEDFSSK